MPDKVNITKTKLDNLANAVAAKSGEPVLLTVDQMTDAVLGINLGEENILEGVKVNNVELPIIDKKVNIPAATLTNNGSNITTGVMTQNLWNYINGGFIAFDNNISYISNQIDSINNAGYITQETDPTVPAWAKQSTKPTYTATEVGALPDTTTIPSKISDLTNDSGYLTQEADPTVPNWAKASTKPSYNFSEIGSTPTTVSGYGITDAYTKTQVDGLVAGVLHYKGTKAAVSNLPTSGNTTGDTWHVTADGSEWAWDGTTWQELGTAVDLSDYVTTDDSRLSDARTPTAHNQALSTITGADDLKAIEALSGTSGLLKKTAANTWSLDTNTYMQTSHAANGITSNDITNWNNKLSSYTETDPVFTASAAANISSTDISNWNSKTSNTGTVTSIGLSNATNGGLTISGSPITNSGSITVGHSNVLFPQTTQAVYPIKIDENGHISAYGSAVNIVDDLQYNSTQKAFRMSRNGSMQDVVTIATLKTDLNIPTKVSDLTNDSGFISSYTETDPVFSASAAAGITSTDISNWNAKSDTDEKLRTGTAQNNTTYYPIFGNMTSVSEIKYDSGNFRYSESSTISKLQLGQVSSSSTAKGRITLCSGPYYTHLDPPAYNTIDESKTYTLPSATGTIALTSDIPQAYSSNNTSGYLTMATLPIYDGTVV